MSMTPPAKDRAQQFSFLKENEPARRNVPLAERMRPQTLDEIIGQDHAVGPDSPLGRILRTPDALVPSILLCGPPGTGKTTIARVIAETSGFHFERISGV